MPGKANRRLAASVEEMDGFVFSWSQRYSGSFWLWGFVVLSLILHATGFYLFQVVYPSSGRVEPFPARVLILDEKNPGNAILLQELNDRLIFLQPASNGSESRNVMDGFAIMFRPSFADRTPPFKKPALGEAVVDSSASLTLPAELSIFPPFSTEDFLELESPEAKDSSIGEPEKKQ